VLCIQRPLYQQEFHCQFQHMYQLQNHIRYILLRNVLTQEQYSSDCQLHKYSTCVKLPQKSQHSENPMSCKLLLHSKHVLLLWPSFHSKTIEVEKSQEYRKCTYGSSFWHTCSDECLLQKQSSFFSFPRFYRTCY